MATATVTPGRIKTGPGVIRWRPAATASADLPSFVAPTASKLIPTWPAPWKLVGSTTTGLTYSESTDADDIKVVESVYNIRKVETGKAGTVAFSMAEIDTVNWSLASNGGTITTSGTGVTKMDIYIPPLAGAGIRISLGFQSFEDDEVIVWPQAYNADGFETARGAPSDIALLPVSFAIELPDPAVLTTPLKRWTSGALATG